MKIENELPTPLTDAEAGYYDGSGCWKSREDGDCVPSSFTRTLERRLIALETQTAKQREALKALVDVYNPPKSGTFGPDQRLWDNAHAALALTPETIADKIAE